MRRCYFCKEPISLLATYYIVKVPTKPKGVSNRWKQIGVACERCQDKTPIKDKRKDNDKYSLYSD